MEINRTRRTETTYSANTAPDPFFASHLSDSEMKRSQLILFLIAFGLACTSSATRTAAAEIRLIQPGEDPAISGKEVDWIYGDYLMKNDQLSLVIAAPLSTRDANMTIRDIGASILDLTLNTPSNDQLSAFTPAAGRYRFHDPSLVETGREGDAVFWQCRSSKTIAGDGTNATVRYRLADGNAFVEARITIEGDAVSKVKAFDGVRADGWFTFQASGNVASCSDSFFRQTIGFKSPLSQRPLTWKQGRPSQLRYTEDHVQRSDSTLEWKVQLYPATSPLDLMSVTENSEASTAMYRFEVSPKTQPDGGVDSVNRALVVLQASDEQGDGAGETYELQTDDQGIAHARLVPGDYIAVVSAIGYERTEAAFKATAKGGSVSLPLSDASGFEAKITDGQGDLIPAKASIYSVDGKDPDFGLSSTRTFVENLVYSVHGRFRCPLDPGKYEIVFSRGPEYNRVIKQLEIVKGNMPKLEVRLDRVVDTSGWISADLHSHSSPSGDNTSDQYGRVENLLCEHVEFAPCTEHNRISSYTPHLDQMKLADLMATCTGMELTGSPLPVNHQNAFPLHHHPHTQNGGGPRISSNPIVQIERLAMWDWGADKLVQLNHPNLHQIYGDLDADGVPDKGFRGMLQWMDVVEVHPLETIFEDVPNNPPSPRRTKIPLFQWMQLLNQGHRIPGVVNTDSHYNHHGSGWLRNWFACSTDDPAEITTEEMVRQAEAGHIVMSTGPFLSVSATSNTSSGTAIPGDDIVAADGKLTVEVRVQCPNWLDVNRVQLFINGRPSEKHNYTRKNSPDLFGDVDAVGKFQSSVPLVLDGDAHVIVATIGEGMTMEKVMGSRYGKRPPIAVSNPIFVDVNGDGFQHNGDELGLPLPRTTAVPEPTVPEPTVPKGYLAVGGDKVAALKQLCQATADTGLYSGAVLVAEGGKVIYSEAFGMANREWNVPNTTDTKFRLASVSKQFCSLVIMQLVQEGSIKLDDTISDHLPYYRKDTGDKITLHHLLAHQSGIKDFTAGFDYRGTISRLSFDPDEFIKLHCSGDLANEPGTIYSYCNAGYCILGRIIERVTRKTFEQNLHTRIFEPLGMKNSGYDRNRYVIEKRASGYTYGAFGLENADYIDMDSSPGASGSLYSTVQDLFLWDRALHTDVLLDEKHRNLMFTPNRDVPEVKAAGGRPQSIYGYGWQIYTRTHPVTKRRTKVVNHGGAINGFRAMENRLVDDDAFVIVLCNQGDPVGSSEVWDAVVRLSNELIHVTTGQPYRMPGKKRLTQDQRMYEIVKSDGVETALDWFKANGKKSGWGGTQFGLATQLIKDGRVDDGLRLMEFDVQQTPGKVWLIRKTAQAYLDNGRPEGALKYATQGLEMRPDDDELKTIKTDAQRDLKRDE